MVRRAATLLLLFLGLAWTTACQAVDDRGLPPPEQVAPGVRLYRLADPALLDPPGPVAVQVLRLDPDLVRLDAVLGRDQVMGRETVPELAARHGAIAAVNAGFFLPNGEPSGLLQVEGELVGDTARPRGAVAIFTGPQNRTRLLFDVVTARARLGVHAGDDTRWIPIAGIDTIRHRGRLMMFTPTYHQHTDTAARGIEWVVAGSPLAVRERRVDAGSTPIPTDGYVLSYGGLAPPPPLDDLAVGAPVTIEREFATHHGTPPGAWATSDHVVGGAGLLLRKGEAITDWAIEDLRKGFDSERHPRTIIGTDSEGDIWLVTVDGRQPLTSLGMSFAELQRLAARLQLTDVLNLDGGGSTTMVVRGVVVNTPSDSTGPREVSDALIVRVKGERETVKGKG
jgi:hypothetical protein